MNKIEENNTNVEFKNNMKMEEAKLFTKTSPKKKSIETNELPIEVTAIINGEKKTIIPAYTNYSMEQPKNKRKWMDKSEKESMLDVIFHFAEPDIFREKGIQLFDRNGKAIKEDTPNVYVVCETADTYWRVFFDEELKKVEVHSYESIEEYAKAIGNTMLFSRGLNNIEKVGVAALVTGDEAYKAVYEFAKTNLMPISTAQAYLDIRLRPSTTSVMMLGHKPKNVPTLGRSVDEAQELFEQVKLAFSPGGANKRYAIRVINNLLKDKKYSMDDIMNCLNTIPSSEIVMAELMDCEDKSLCIQRVLLSWLMKMKSNRANNAA